MSKFALPYAKGLLILGLVLVVSGLCILGFLLVSRPSEVVNRVSLDTTTTDSYFSDKFRAEDGYWLDLDITSNASSTIHVIGQTKGEIFKVDGTRYEYVVLITAGDVYQVQVENKANYWNWWTFSTVYVENQISGTFNLERRPNYFFQLIPLGAVLVAIGLLITLPTGYLEHNARQKARLLYECPRCKKTVQIGLAVCPYCKLDLTKYWIRCKYCNRFYDSHLEKCPKCGAETEV